MLPTSLTSSSLAWPAVGQALDVRGWGLPPIEPHVSYKVHIPIAAVGVMSLLNELINEGRKGFLLFMILLRLCFSVSGIICLLQKGGVYGGYVFLLHKVVVLCCRGVRAMQYTINAPVSSQYTGYLLRYLFLRTLCCISSLLWNINWTTTLGHLLYCLHIQLASRCVSPSIKLVDYGSHCPALGNNQS